MTVQVETEKNETPSADAEAKQGLQAQPVRKPRLLFVDDEPNILQSLERHLHGDFEMFCATSGKEALEIVAAEPEFPVIVSDMRMPEMMGNELLVKVREISPDTQRIILTGQADIETTLDAVNNGQIFRFLTKPCKVDALRDVLGCALEQHRLIKSEHTLLQDTLSGAVKTLVEVLATINPTAGRRNARINRYVDAVMSELSLNYWEVRIAGMLSQIGSVSLPAETLEKIYSDAKLTPEELGLYHAQYKVAASLIRSIPRLEVVTEIILAQEALPTAGFCGEQPADWEKQQLGAVVVGLATEIDGMVSRGGKLPLAIQSSLDEHPDIPEIMKTAFRDIVRTVEDSLEPQVIGLKDLLVGMVLDEELKAKSGVPLCQAGQEVSSTVLKRLHTIGEGIGVSEPFRVLVPS